LEENAMTHGNAKTAFVDRFDETRSVVRRFQLLYGGCWTVAAGGCGLVALALADYAFELSWGARAVGLGVVATVGFAVAVAAILAPVLWWSRPRTAVEIEQRFPQLGQRVRTVLQFSGRTPTATESEGVLPSLVNSLEEDTDARARPLDLSSIVPWGKLRVARILALVPLALLLGGFLFHWESRLAVFRAFLSDRPYTTLAVAPGDLLVDAGDDVTLSIRLQGRVDRDVVFFSRASDDRNAVWQERRLPASDADKSGRRVAEYTVALEEVTRPLDYRVTAAPALSDLYQIAVRPPLAVETFKAVLTPPAYTGVKPETVESRDLEVIEGTRVRFLLTLDRPCRQARLVLTDPPGEAEDDAQDASEARIPLELADGVFFAEMQFHEDRAYSIEAVADGGSSLPENRHLVRVRKDAPPQVRFEDPDEALEVHPIAEVLMRIRAGDDFGLTRAGIVFQVNAGEEQTLLVDDFTQPTAPEDESTEPSRTTRAICERMLLLEEHELTPTDSITYYAFAEDCFPDGPRQTVTDLRFIDVRPFKRIYKVGGT